MKIGVLGNANKIKSYETITEISAFLKDLGIEGTPSFVVSSKSGNELVSGFKSFEDFKVILDDHLSE